MTRGLDRSSDAATNVSSEKTFRTPPRDAIRRRWRGCMLGGAVGDALGAPVEFMSLAEIRERFGPRGIVDFTTAFARPGEITDDTRCAVHGRGLLARTSSRRWMAMNIPCSGFHLTRLASRGDDSTLLDTPATGLADRGRGCRKRVPGHTCLLLSAMPAWRAGTQRQQGLRFAMRVGPSGLFARASRQHDQRARVALRLSAANGGPHPRSSHRQVARAHSLHSWRFLQGMGADKAVNEG